MSQKPLIITVEDITNIALRTPPGVRHELSNPSSTDETVFLLVQASREGFDYLPTPFRTIETVLPFSPRT
jgi:hypothetical protein